MLVDYEAEDDIPDKDRDMHLRYELVNSNFALAAKVAYRAIGYKACCG